MPEMRGEGGDGMMTGVEKLREFTLSLEQWDLYAHADALRDVADQIERETLQKPRFEDGEPVQFGDRFVANTGEVRQVARITCFDNGRSVLISECGHRYIVGKEKADGKRAKRPEPPKVLDADGVEINVGDEVWGIGREQHAYKVLEPKSGDEYARGRFTVKCVDLTYGELVVYADPSSLTHKRPETEDSWEQIEADASDDIMVLDFVRRCKALAGVE